MKRVGTGKKILLDFYVFGWFWGHWRHADQVRGRGTKLDAIVATVLKLFGDTHGPAGFVGPHQITDGL